MLVQALVVRLGLPGRERVVSLPVSEYAIALATGYKESMILLHSLCSVMNKCSYTPVLALFNE